MVNNSTVTLMIIGTCCLFVSACSVEATPSYSDNEITPSTDEHIYQTKVMVDIEQAISKQDYRLLATSGRSITLPGITIEKVAAVSVLCGVKYTPATGDVIKNNEQRNIRNQQLIYMKQYNQNMIKICNTMNNIVK